MPEILTDTLDLTADPFGAGTGWEIKPPELILEDLDGDEFRVSPLGGQKVVIVS